MKRSFLLFVFLCYVLVTSAHPPKKIVLNTDLKNKSLSINIVHPVKDSEKHFISDVKVSLNGQVIEEKKFTKQSTTTNEIISMTIDEMKEGDKIEVECVCNKAGRKKASVVVKSYYTQSK